MVLHPMFHVVLCEAVDKNRHKNSIFDCRRIANQHCQTKAFRANAVYPAPCSGLAAALARVYSQLQLHSGNELPHWQ